jgi:hypothetical protein
VLDGNFHIFDEWLDIAADNVSIYLLLYVTNRQGWNQLALFIKYARRDLGEKK